MRAAAQQTNMNGKPTTLLWCTDAPRRSDSELRSIFISPPLSTVPAACLSAAVGQFENFVDLFPRRSPPSAGGVCAASQLHQTERSPSSDLRSMAVSSSIITTQRWVTLLPDDVPG